MAELKLTDELEKNIKELFNKSIEGSKKDVCDKAVEYSFKLSAACNIKPKKEIDKYTFKICEAVKLGLDKFFVEENKPVKITKAHTDYAKRIIPTLPKGWMQQKHSWDACKA